MKTYRETCAMFERMEITEHVYKVKSTKKLLGQMPNVIVMPGNERKEKPPHLPIPRRSAISSAGN